MFALKTFFFAFKTTPNHFKKRLVKYIIAFPRNDFENEQGVIFPSRRKFKSICLIFTSPWSIIFKIKTQTNIVIWIRFIKPFLEGRFFQWKLWGKKGSSAINDNGKGDIFVCLSNFMLWIILYLI